MECVVINKTRDKKWRQYDELFDTTLKAVMDKFDIKTNYVVSIILAKNKYIHKVNLEYRNIDKTTDVITFASLEGENFGCDEIEVELGDIFINVDRVVSQALDYQHSEKREIAFLLVHGLLHCLGYDHLNEKDEKIMIDLQKEILDPIVKRNDDEQI